MTNICWAKVVAGELESAILEADGENNIVDVYTGRQTPQTLLSTVCINPLCTSPPPAGFPIIAHHARRPRSIHAPTATFGALIGVKALPRSTVDRAIGSHGPAHPDFRVINSIFLGSEKENCGQCRRRVYAVCEADFVSCVLEKRLGDLA
jgi:hypothetical protein